MMFLSDVSNFQSSTVIAAGGPKKIQVGSFEFKPKQPQVLPIAKPSAPAQLEKIYIEEARQHGVLKAARFASSDHSGETLGSIFAALASFAKRSGDCGVAEQLFVKALELGSGSAWESDVRADYGRMLEESGVYDRAVSAYAGAKHPSSGLRERHLSLLMRLGRTQEACTIVVSSSTKPSLLFSPLPSPSSSSSDRPSADPYRLWSLGLLPADFPCPPVSPMDASQIDFFCGSLVSAITLASSTMSSSSSLHLADLCGRAFRLCIPRFNESLRVAAQSLSCPTLRKNLLLTSQMGSDGTLKRVASEASRRAERSATEGRESDWRVWMSLARGRSWEGHSDQQDKKNQNKDNVECVVVGACESPDVQVALGKAARQCETGQRWRVWLEASQLPQQDDAKRRALVAKALRDCPEKQRSSVLIEAARAEEQSSHEVSMAILKKAWEETRFWKVGLEMAHLHLAVGQDREEALSCVKNALEMNPTIGRLWASLARMLESASSLQESIVAAGLKLVPRSGELWVERGRALSMMGTSWQEVESCFRYAIIFTPQYGDVFVEMTRSSLWRCLASRFGLQALRNEISREEIQSCLAMWNTTSIEHACVLSSPNHGHVWDKYLQILGQDASPIEVFASAKSDMISTVINAETGSLKEILFCSK